MSVAPRQIGNPERIITGIARLDGLLNGGIPRYSVVFVAGLPGTGKTILSEQCAFANAAQGRTCLYYSTISEPVLKVLRFLQGFSSFDANLLGSTVIYGDLGSPLRSGGPAAFTQELDRLVREHAAADVREGAETSIADDIIDLYDTEEPEQQRRNLRVMKMRGSSHDVRLHEFILDPPHMRVGAPLTDTGMLGETMREVGEGVTPPLPQRAGGRW